MERRKIKKGNDFIYLWSIVRNGLPENLAYAENRKLYLHTANGAQELTDYSIVGGNIVRIEFTPEVTAALGDYRMELSYTVADDTLADKGRKCAVDTYAFTIVSHSEDVDVSTELAATSEIAIGLQGKKGEPFRFEDLTETQKEELKLPATEAANIVQNLIARLEAKLVEVDAKLAGISGAAVDITFPSTRQLPYTINGANVYEMALLNPQNNETVQFPQGAEIISAKGYIREKITGDTTVPYYFTSNDYLQFKFELRTFNGINFTIFYQVQNGGYVDRDVYDVICFIEYSVPIPIEETCLTC